MLAYANCYILNSFKKGLILIRNLTDVDIFETVVVEKIVGDEDLQCRIMELGITKGVEIFVKKFAPLKDPIEISVRGYNLCLGKDEAKNILVV